MSIRSNKKKTSNPLFVVTNKGKDVEQAEDLIDALIKKYGVKPFLDLMNTLFEFVKESLKGHTAVVIMAGLIDDFVEGLENIMKMIDPVLAFSFFKR